MSNGYIPIKLPSKCLPYENVDPTKIAIRTLRGKDEKLISEMTEENFERKFMLLLNDVLQGIEPGKLTVGDRMYLALWETINSYSNEFEREFECEHCWQRSRFLVDLNKINVKELDDSYKQPYTVKLPKSGQDVQLRLLTLNDMVKLDDLSKSGQNVWLYRYAMSMASPGSNLAERVEFLEQAEALDVAKVRDFQEQFYHGPEMKLAYECPKCGGTGEMPVPFRIEMLIPYGKTLSRIVGNAISDDARTSRNDIGKL